MDGGKRVTFSAGLLSAAGEGKVSVIIPCFNQGRFLGDAIESALAQSHAPREVIVVDDGSSDETADVAGGYPVRYVRQRNQGRSTARNRGLRESSGDFVVFLDADDRLLADALRSGMECMAASPDSAFVYGRFYHIAEDGRFLKPPPDPPADEDLYLALLRYNHIGMLATVLFRRSVLEAVGGYHPGLTRAQDYELFLRIARACPIRRHEGIIAEYRKYRNCISEDLDLLRGVLTALRWERRYLRGRPAHLAAWREGVSGNRNWYTERILQHIRSPLPGSAPLRKLHLWVSISRADPRGVALRAAGSFGRRLRGLIRLARH